MISYENFDLWIRSDGEQFEVRAQLGSQSASEPFPVERALSKSLRYLEGAEPDVIQRQGLDLFNALIRGRVRDLYQQARGAVGDDPAAGLRIRLRFDPGDERLRPLINIPWEILRDPFDTRNDPPALDSRRPVVRMIDTTERSPAPDDGPLQRVLLALANPRDADAGYSDLDLSRERAAVETALACIPIYPEVIARTTREALFERITDSNPQIVHFMGHSEVDPKTGDGVLILENESGAADPFPGMLFARLFSGKSAPRLVILTSCLSAVQGQLHKPFAGIAYALAAAGLPAVIAMQSELRDTSAIRFTERLYRLLAGGHPIEAAVADARKALSISTLGGLDWAAPVLFLRESSAPERHAARSEPSRLQPTEPVQFPYFGTTIKAGKAKKIVTNNNVYQGTKP
jgi:hypothetical protein